MHQDKPAVGIVLRRAGLSRQIATQGKARSQTLPSPLVHGPAQHLSQVFHRFLRHDARVFGCEFRQRVTMLVGDAGDENRLAVLAARSDGAVSRNHFQWSNRAGSQRQGRDFVELALVDSHFARKLGGFFWANFLHDLCGDGVLRIYETLARCHLTAARRR
jgi:hypothetical protein